MFLSKTDHKFSCKWKKGWKQEWRLEQKINFSMLKTKPIRLSNNHKSQRPPSSKKREFRLPRLSMYVLISFYKWKGDITTKWLTKPLSALKGGGPCPLHIIVLSSHETNSCVHCHIDSRGNNVQKHESMYTQNTHIGCFLVSGKADSIYIWWPGSCWMVQSTSWRKTRLPPKFFSAILPSSWNF